MLLVVETGGVGYELRVPLSTLEAVQGQPQVFLYTHLLVREDDLRLYGFSSRAERELFELVLSVSGVGPSLALAALSALSVDELVTALATGDATSIQRVKGIGKRLAERLVVELKDRVGSSRLATRAAAGSEGGLAGGPGRFEVADAVSALLSLGFSHKEADKRVSAAHEVLTNQPRVPGGNGGVSVERLIREALC